MPPTREQHPTSEVLTENPAGAARNMITVPTDSGWEPRRAESDLSFDDRYAAWWSGVEYGMAEQFRLDVDDAVQAALYQQAQAALRMARRYAAAKGPAWEAMIVWSGAADD